MLVALQFLLIAGAEISGNVNNGDAAKNAQDANKQLISLFIIKY